MPKVSVIVPNYNHARFLPQRLDSIFNQTFQDFEVILLDDCSNDNSHDVLKIYHHHPKVSAIIFNKVNSQSTFKQWKKGIELASGEYIWLAESDDYCKTSFLNELVPQLDNHPDVGIAYCQSISVDSENTFSNSWLSHTRRYNPNIWDTSFYVKGQSAIQNLFIHRNIIPNASAVLFRKSIYTITSGINTGMTLNGDWLLWVKILEKSDLIFIADELNFFRQHGQKTTSRNMRNFNAFSEQVDLFRYIEKNVGITKIQKEEMSNALIRKWLHQIAIGNIQEGLVNVPRIFKQLLKFNKYALVNILQVIFSLIFKERMLNKQQKKHDITKMPINQLI